MSNFTELKNRAATYNRTLGDVAKLHCHMFNERSAKLEDCEHILNVLDARLCAQVLGRREPTYGQG